MQEEAKEFKESLASMTADNNKMMSDLNASMEEGRRNFQDSSTSAAESAEAKRCLEEARVNN